MAKSKRNNGLFTDIFNTSGKSGGDSDMVLHYTPAPGEPIEVTAKVVLAEMRKRRMDAEVHFKNFTYVVCLKDRITQYDFVESYYDAVEEAKQIMAERSQQNKGSKKPPRRNR